MLALFLSLLFSAIAFVATVVIVDAWLKGRGAWQRLQADARQLDLVENGLRAPATLGMLNMDQRMRPAHAAPRPASPRPTRRRIVPLSAAA
ncbi:MAG: hypothetical protein R3E18_02340 [Sphingomonadaceae bacterium]|nr:hypothetical protein [Sphingomonadaceae bacterium]